ncbi:MAG TPA: hypothetical protein VGE57_00645 [Solimonas sp.]
MQTSFKVGDVVERRENGQRMKVASIEADSGLVRCAWTRGAVKRTQSFEPAALRSCGIPAARS